MKMKVIDEFGQLPDDEKIKDMFFDLIAQIAKTNNQASFIFADPNFVNKCKYREYLKNSQSGEQLQLECTWQPADNGVNSGSIKGL